MRHKVSKERDLREIPQTKVRATAKPLSHDPRPYADRNRATVAVYASGGYTMQNIGDFFAYTIRA